MPRRGLAQTTALALCVVWSGIALAADPPRLSDFTPAGVSRGTETAVVVSGQGLIGAPRLFTAVPVVVLKSEEPNKEGTSWKVSVSVPPETPVGIYPARVVTEGGISNPMLLAVGQVPQVSEVEPNNTAEAAFALPALPVVVEGEIRGADVDRFGFSGKKGQRIVLDAVCARIGSGIDPQIRLTTKAGALVAGADDTPGLSGDVRLFTELPEDGDYLIELSDTKYAAGGRASYRLTVGPIPVVGEVYPLGGRVGETLGVELRGGTLPGERLLGAVVVPGEALGEAVFRPRLTAAALGVGGSSLDVELPCALARGAFAEVREPADPGAPADLVAAPVVLNGRLDPAGDEDRFRLAVTPGQKIRVRVDASEFGSAVDGVLQVLRLDGQVLATADDTTVPANLPGFLGRAAGAILTDPAVTLAIPEGVTEVQVVLRDLGRDGGTGYPYRIVAERVAPEFELVIGSGELTLPKGGSALLPVSVLRQDFNGPITVSVANLPAGVTARGGVIDAGQTVGVISLHAALDAVIDPAFLHVIGVGKTDAGEIRAQGMKRLVFAQAGEVVLDSTVQKGLAVVSGAAGPVTVETPSEPVEVLHGIKTEIPLTLKRADGATGGLKFTALPLPANVLVEELAVGEGASEAKAAVTVALEAPLGTFSVGMIGVGKVVGADRSVATPAITLAVVRPAGIELSTDKIVIKAGEKAELKGKITRKGAFKEPVQVSVQGLPAGVEAAPLTVAPDANELTLAFSAKADAAAAEAKAQAVLGFKIGDKDYPAVPVPVTIQVTK